MKLKELFKDCKYEIINGDLEKEVTEIAYDSRKIKEGNLFVAISGFMTDGHKYIDKAIEQGATSILVEQDTKISNKNITIIKVDNSRQTLASISRTFYNYPDKELTTIGITGTKGKTTTSWTIMKILENAGHKAGCIGTMGVFFNKKHYHTVNTSPESYDVYKYIREMLDDGIKYLVMEVSSQSLKLSRWIDMTFDYAIFTNLSPDHIGENEHKDYEEYATCKSLLFKQCKTGIFNIDDKEYSRMTKDFTNKKYTFGVSPKADLRLISSKNIIESGFIGIEMETSGLINDKFKVSMPGNFNAYNMMCALLIGKILGIPTESMKKTLKHISVRGRLEPINISNKFNVLIDYAYQGIAMENVIKTIREAGPKRIVVLFGCGGNRSKQRRYDCGRIASTYADFSILTSDNPRYEDNDDIIKDILSTFVGENYVIIPDRKEAIKYGITHAKEGDVLMILGKGHETYQEVKGESIPFDERKIIKEILEELPKEQKENL